MNDAATDPTARTGQIERALLVVVLVAFGALTIVALAVDGLTGFGDAITFNWAAFQIYVDLVIAAVVIAVWIYRDARRRGVNPWPWIVGTAIAGMFAPLVYLLVRRAD
ncbi:MAG: abscisic acid-deficient protein Aba4 family protein [Actinomycetota bacterium]